MQAGASFATCRHPETADALHNLARKYPRLSVHRLDVTQAESVYALRAELQDERSTCSSTMPASIWKVRTYSNPVLRGVAADPGSEHTLGPLRVTEALAELVAGSHRKLVVTLSSHMGSIF